MPSPFVCVYQSRSFQAATGAGGWGQALCGAAGSAVLTAVFVAAAVLLARSRDRKQSLKITLVVGI
jgi:hypothetical protein